MHLLQGVLLAIQNQLSTITRVSLVQTSSLGQYLNDINTILSKSKRAEKLTALLNLLLTKATYAELYSLINGFNFLPTPTLAFPRLIGDRDFPFAHTANFGSKLAY